VNAVALGFWAHSSSRFKRFITILLCLVFCIVLTIAGTLTPLGAQEAKSLNDEVDQLRASAENMSLWQGTLSFFENNFFIDLIMFIPIAGQVYGSLSMYEEGLAFNAQSTSTNVNPMHWPATLIFLANFVSPHQLLEYIAYATAFAAGIWLFWRILKGEGKRELIRTGKFILICAVLLLAAAFIEEYLVLLFYG
jgi:uncharacterized membrane protein SpoIIM required for sporulation